MDNSIVGLLSVVVDWAFGGEASGLKLASTGVAMEENTDGIYGSWSYSVLHVLKQRLTADFWVAMGEFYSYAMDRKISSTSKQSIE